MIVGARQASLSLPETAELLGFTPLKFNLSGAKNKKTASERFFCRRKHLVDERDQRRVAKLV